MTRRYFRFFAQNREIQLGLNFQDGKSNHEFVKKHILQGSFYEPDVSLFLLRAIQSVGGGGKYCIDVGANLGFHTVLMASLVGKQGKVVCFEPDPNNISDLRANIHLNTFEDRVEIISSVVKDSSGEINFFLNNTDSGGSALWDPKRWPGDRRAQLSEKCDMPATTLDREIFQREMTPINILKIDTEGAEHLVLQGARGLLGAGLVKYIICELHEFGLECLGSSQQLLRNYMHGFGYETFILGLKGGMPRFCPSGTKIKVPGISNILFTKIDSLSHLWPEMEFPILDY